MTPESAWLLGDSAELVRNCVSGTVARRHVLNEAETPTGPGTLIARYVDALERIRDLPPGAWDKTMRKIARDALD